MKFEKKSLLIVFLGPDGSGKTTHLRLLSNYLRCKGYKVRVVWLSSHHGLAWLLNKLITFFGLYVSRPSVTNPLAKYVPAQLIRKSMFLRVILSFSELVSVVAYLAYIRLLLRLGYVVIVERFLPSTLADFIYSNYILLKEPLDTTSLILSSSIAAFMQKIPAIYIHLDAEYSTILKRRKLLTEPYDYIKCQKIIYDKLLKTLIGKSSLSFKTDTSIRIIQSKIRDSVINHLKNAEKSDA